MAKKRRNYIISPLSFDIEDFKIYQICNNGSVYYRCKYCFHSKIKNANNKFFKIRGHLRNCYVYNKKIINDIKLDSNKYININEYSKEFVEKSVENKLCNNKNDKFEPKIKNDEYYDNFFGDNKKEDKIILNNIAIYTCRIIGKGSFKKSYFAYNLNKNEEVIAKISLINAQDSINLNELNVLTKLQNYQGFPKLIENHKCGKFNIIIENLLGPSLKRIMEFYESPFNIETISYIGVEILKRLKNIA